MTATARVTTFGAAVNGDALEVIGALQQAIDAGRALGLDVSVGEAVASEATDRLGIAPDAYVIAFVGGTGVGKSSLLNALAGEVVSPASAVRPTTAAPIAWVAAEAVGETRPLLDRLGVTSAFLHASAALGRVVILDLPDVDSLEVSHRTAVERALPKLDVIAWVMDPEKYADAALHDDFLRTWMPRLGRQLVVLNKVDRLDGDDRARVIRDLRRTLPRDAPVITTSAAAGAAGVSELRAWLAEAVNAKAVIAARLIAAARAAISGLSREAGLFGGDGTGAQLISPADQARAKRGAVEEALRLVDLPGTERQAVAATRARARRRGTGAIGILTSAIYRFSGRQRRVADPAAYLSAWRNRGGLTRATELIRRAITDALPAVPPALRPRYAAAGESSDLEGRIAMALDRVIARRAGLEPPSSRMWPLVGLLQSANTVLLVVAVSWLVLWVIVRPTVASWDLPILGPLPAPMVLLGAGLVLGFLLARVLSIHAGHVGRRWARGITGELRRAVAEVIDAEAFAPLVRIEAARTELGASWRRAGR